MSADRVDPDPARLGRRLRKLRLRVGYNGHQAARRTGMSQAKISRLETSRLIPQPNDIRTLCGVYGADSNETDELLKLTEHVREESKRSTILLPRGAARLQQQIKKVEAQATFLRSFQPSAIVGLLQTEDYIRAIWGNELPEDDLNDVVAARLARQDVLSDQSKQFVLIMSEGAVRWQLGSAQLMAEQVDAVVEATRLPTVRLGIIPWHRPVSVVTNAGFHLYDSAAVVVGTEVQSAAYDDHSAIATYEQLFGELEMSASFGDDARKELARIASEYRLLA